MTSQSGSEKSAARSAAPESVAAEGRGVSTRAGVSSPVTEQGKTSIAEVVVTKIAGLAAREVSGVYKLGGSAARAVGTIRERIPGTRSSVGQGVSVEVGERQAAVDLDLMVEYGVDILELATAIRRNVSSSIERMTGLEVTEVNVNVDDIHLPDEQDHHDQDKQDQDKQDQDKPRVQ